MKNIRSWFNHFKKKILPDFILFLKNNWLKFEDNKIKKPIVAAFLSFKSFIMPFIEFLIKYIYPILRPAVEYYISLKIGERIRYTYLIKYAGKKAFRRRWQIIKPYIFWDQIWSIIYKIKKIVTISWIKNKRLFKTYFILKKTHINNYLQQFYIYNFVLNYVKKIDFYYKKSFAEENHVDPQLYILKQNKSLTFSEVINLLYRRQKNTYYSPFISFWPIFLSFSVALFILLIIIFFFSTKLNYYSNGLTYVAILGVSISVSFWFSIFFTEKRKGNHVADVRRNIELGFYLFLLTEALCFIALFWVFLHSFLAASLHVGLYNPGEGITNLYMNEVVKISRYWDIYQHHNVGTPSFYRLSSFFTLFDTELFKHKNKYVHINFFDKGQLINPYGFPLLNTFILLTSAATLNASHVSLKVSKFFRSFFWLFVTILLGLFFVSIQYIEYKECTFQYNDGIYAASFFSLTGLHGFHVIIGVSALIVCLINLLFKNYSSGFHQSYIYSIFYWHFVDVIWIFVYIVIYLWPAYFFYEDGAHTFYVSKKDIFVCSFNTDYFIEALKSKIRFVSKKNDFIFFENLLRLPLMVLIQEMDSENLLYAPLNKISSSINIIKGLNIKSMACNFFVYLQKTDIVLDDLSNVLFIYINKLDFENSKNWFDENFFTKFSNYELELNYWNLYNESHNINYNELKRSEDFRCLFLTIMHQNLVLNCENLLINDLKDHFILTCLAFYLPNVSINLWIFYCGFFYPYLLDSKALSIPSFYRYYF